MSFYFEHNWFLATFASGRKSLIKVVEVTPDGYLGVSWDHALGAESKLRKFISKHGVELDQLETADIASIASDLDLTRRQALGRARRKARAEGGGEVDEAPDAG